MWTSSEHYGEIVKMSNLYVYMFRSRNKDNKEIKGFKERCKTIVAYRENEDKVRESFEKFAAEGLLGEKTRLYRSVNSRNEEKVREELIIRLLRDKPNITELNRVLASVAQQVENRDESKWLFDFDCDDILLMNLFVKDIKEMSKVYWDEENTELAIKSVEVEAYKTPHGYAIITSNGFDTRELMEKWKDYDITLKRDELLFLDMKENLINE